MTKYKQTEIDPFDEWVASLPEEHWAKYDLSACRMGWDAAMQYVEEARGDS